MTDSQFLIVRHAVANGTIPYGEVNVATRAMLAEVDRLRSEADGLRKIALVATARAEEVEDLEDAVRCLAEIGEMVGFGQVDWGGR